jgi:hypothetical protein
MHMISRLAKTIIVLFAGHIACAQTLTNTTGATISSSGLVIEYSIGEIGITTLSSTNNFVTQGLLQPAIKVPNPECPIINDIIQYFPSPTQDKIRIVGRHDWIKSYIIYASDGKLVGRSDYYNNHIDISGLSSGVYFIVLYPAATGNSKL